MNKDIQQPLNAQERYLYEMVIRQGVIIEQLQTIIEGLGFAKQEKPQIVEVQEEVVEEVKPAPRKRQTRKKVE